MSDLPEYLEDELKSIFAKIAELKAGMHELTAKAKEIDELTAAIRKLIDSDKKLPL